MSTPYINLEEVLRLHFQLIEDFGGSHGVRDEGQLKSVIEAPKREAFGSGQYPTIFEKAAVYLRNIVGDPPFVDGNKRTALTVCGIFLRRNNKRFTASQKELEDFIVSVAVDYLDIAQVAVWIDAHSN